MHMRKKILIAGLLSLLLVGSGAQATNYTPLVPLPGMPEGGAFDLSTYLIGFYNFLLSIVGIVAVLFMIFGGLKYITAVGNSSKIGDAKNQIMSAITGLLLALLSWVIVDTINPDILYMRQPGVAFNELLNGSTGICSTYTTDENGVGTCTCVQGGAGDSTSPQACDQACIASGGCGEVGGDTACIMGGSPADQNAPGYIPSQGCACADGTHLVLEATSTAGCNAACREAKKCGNKFLAIKFSSRGEPAPNPDQYGNQVFIVRENDSQNHALWHFALTNDASQYEQFRITGEGMRSDGTEIPGGEINTADQTARANFYDCAILVTNEETAGQDETYIFWVKEGGSINRNSGLSMFTQLHDYLSEATSCCNRDPQSLCGVEEGWIIGNECDANMPAHVLATPWVDNVQNSCVNCSFADWEGEQVNFRPSRTIKCVGGYWR